jgi:uncharacterized protein YigA (DUF484 family)
MLETENEALKQDRRKDASTVDIKSGEVAVGRVAMEALEKDIEALKVERIKNTRLINQYKIEKSHVMETLMSMSAEVDEAQRLQQDLQRRCLNERRIRLLLHQNTMDFLKSKAVDPAIIKVSIRT